MLCSRASACRMQGRVFLACLAGAGTARACSVTPILTLKRGVVGLRGPGYHRKSMFMLSCLTSKCTGEDCEERTKRRNSQDHIYIGRKYARCPAHTPSPSCCAHWPTFTAAGYESTTGNCLPVLTPAGVHWSTEDYLRLLQHQQRTYWRPMAGHELRAWAEQQAQTPLTERA